MGGLRHLQRLSPTLPPELNRLEDGKVNEMVYTKTASEVLTKITDGIIFFKVLFVGTRPSRRMSLGECFEILYATYVTMTAPLALTQRKITWVVEMPSRSAALSNALSTGPPGNVVIGLCTSHISIVRLEYSIQTLLTQGFHTLLL